MTTTTSKKPKVGRAGARASAEKSATRARGNSKREQREASIEAILASALKLFVHKGYRSTTVDEIAAASGLTKGAVYFYFPTKAAVLFALLDEIEDLMVNKMVARVGVAGPSIEDKLVALLHSQSQMGLDRAEWMLLFILMLLEFNGAGDEVEARVKAIYQRYYISIEEIIHRGKLTGEFRADLDTRAMSAIIMAINNGTMMEWYCRSDMLNGRELVRAARAIALTGTLGKPQPPAAG